MKSEETAVKQQKDKSGNKRITRVAKGREFLAKAKEEMAEMMEENYTSEKENVDPKTLAATEQKLPDEYADLKELFEQPKTYQLPRHGRHDHEIPLQKGKDPACRKI